MEHLAADATDRTLYDKVTVHEGFIVDSKMV